MSEEREVSPEYFRAGHLLNEIRRENAALLAEVARLREEDRTNTDRMVELALAKDRAVAARDALAKRVEELEEALRMVQCDVEICLRNPGLQNAEYWYLRNIQLHICAHTALTGRKGEE